jgi:uncharacterized RDD family membrane protein YckC
MLDAEGKPRTGLSLDYVALLLLLTYLIAMEHRFGATLGKMLVGIRTMDVDHPERAGIPWRKAIIRQLAMWAALIPMFAVYFAFYIADQGDLEAMAQSSLILWILLAGLLAVAWWIWILVSVLRKRDPIYDRLAGTAVTPQLLGPSGNTDSAASTTPPDLPA